jgi:hypothetical protein
MLRNAKVFIVLVKLVADIPLVDLVVDGGRMDILVLEPGSSFYTFEQQHNGAAPRVHSWL